MKHTLRMLKCGTKIVAGVNPRKQGEIVDFDGEPIPVFKSVDDAKRATNANASVIFVPPAFAKDAIIEAVDAQLEVIVIITEGIAQADSIYFNTYAHQKSAQIGRRIQIVGPNCPGVVFFNADDSNVSDNLGIIPDKLSKGFGPLGLVSKSGTLTYQMLEQLGEVGFKTCIGIGGDVSPGTNYIDALKDFESDGDISAIILIGEIGGDAEEQAARYISEHVKKPVVAYIAGVAAPEGKTMGHAGAIVSASSGRASDKISALESVGVKVGKTPEDVAWQVQRVLAAGNPSGDVCLDGIQNDGA
jgi:succinyl-CoA synthetase alpha subunit